MKKIKARPADVILFFQLPLGIEASCVNFCAGENGKEDTVSDPMYFKASAMYGVAQALQHKGYVAYKNSSKGFEAYICVRNGFDVDRGRAIGKDFLIEVAAKLMAELGGSKVQ